MVGDLAVRPGSEAGWRTMPIARGARTLAVAVLPCLLAQSAASQAPENDTPAEPPNAMAAYDRPGIRRDTAYFVGYQFVAVGVISVWPQSDTGYSNKIGFERWRYNVTHPHWDGDRHVVNYVLHPYWGAGYYIRARERGLDRTQSFWYSALLSSIFEYGAEAMVEQVSYQDLIVTPVLGSLLGEYVFSPLRDHIHSKAAPLDRWDRLALVLTDPLGAINSAVDQAFGVETHVSLAPMLGGIDTSHGFAATTRPSLQRKVGWGLQLRVTW